MVDRHRPAVGLEPHRAEGKRAKLEKGPAERAPVGRMEWTAAAPVRMKGLQGARVVRSGRGAGHMVEAQVARGKAAQAAAVSMAVWAA